MSPRARFAQLVEELGGDIRASLVLEVSPTTVWNWINNPEKQPGRGSRKWLKDHGIPVDGPWYGDEKVVKRVKQRRRAKAA